jgi:hypothetical protein
MTARDSAGNPGSVTRISIWSILTPCYWMITPHSLWSATMTAGPSQRSIIRRPIRLRR